MSKWAHMGKQVNEQVSNGMSRLISMSEESEWDSENEMDLKILDSF